MSANVDRLRQLFQGDITRNTAEALALLTDEVELADAAAVVPASTTVSGIVTLATQTEVNTGTNTSKTVTPATLLGATNVTPAGFVSVVQYGAVGDGTTDDSAAFAAAGVAAIAAGKGVWVPAAASSYRIAIEVEFVGSATNQTAFEMRLSPSATILIDTPADNAFAFENFHQAIVRGGIIRGKTGRLVDCVRAFYFAACYQGIVEDVIWKWICSSISLIGNISGGLIVRRNTFLGASTQAAFISSDSWTRFVVEDCSCADIGYIGGVTTGSKIGASANQCFPAEFIRAGDVTAMIGAFSQAPLVLRNIWCDENIGRAVLINPTTAPLSHAVIENYQKSSGIDSSFGAIPEFDITNVTNLEIRRSCALQLGAGGGRQRDAISLVSVTHAIIDRFKCATQATDTNRIVADSACSKVELIGMLPGVDFRTLASSAALTITKPDSYPGELVVNDRRSSPDLMQLIGSLRSFFDARDIITASGSTAIDKWGNQRANQDTTLALNSLTATTTARPVTGNTVNGRPVITFDGTNDVLASSSTVGVAVLDKSGYIAWVFSPTAVSGTNADYRENDGLITDGAGYIWCSLRNNSSVYTINAGINDGAAKTPATPHTVALGSWYLFEMFWDGTTLTTQLNGDTVQTIAAGSIAVVSGAVSIGKNYSAAKFFNGQLAAFISAAAVPTAVERKAIRAALSNQFALGITA